MVCKSVDVLSLLPLPYPHFKIVFIGFQKLGFGKIGVVGRSGALQNGRVNMCDCYIGDKLPRYQIC